MKPKNTVRWRRIIVATLLACCDLLSTTAAEPDSALTSRAVFDTLRGGDTVALRELLGRGASPNARDASGNTPLMLAAVYGGVADMRLLLKRGAEVNATNLAGATPLLRAAFDFEKLRLLVERGADVNARSALGNTALMLAARPANSYRAVELLLTHGADAGMTNQFGATALMAAAAGGDEKSVRLLIEHGAAVNAQPTADQAGFIFGGGRSALMWAAFRGNVPIMKQLIEAGANVNEMSGLGTPLGQAAWANHIAAARLLIERGARVNQPGPRDGYTALHWAASSEEGDVELIQLLLKHNADPNLGGGENVDAFLGTQQTPLMLARRRGDTPILATLVAAGATNGTRDRVTSRIPPARNLAGALGISTLRHAVGQAVPPLQETAIRSKQSFLRHGSRQDCTSCHQQFLPMAAIALARKEHVRVDKRAEQKLVEMVLDGEIKNSEADWQALFHPEPAHTKGYALFALAAEDVAATEKMDAWVHHLSVIQGEEGQWFNNLPRPPIQTSDIGATALAVHALQHYSLPGRKREFAQRVNRARQWLWQITPHNQEGRVYQLLGLSWAGELPAKLQPLAKTLLGEQRADGGWAQLPAMQSDAYATGQAVYALRVAARLDNSDAAIERGLRFLLNTQLEDGTWHVHRRAFPFQPTMDSGFPHGRDSWISSAATSWAVLALSLPEPNTTAALNH